MDAVELRRTEVSNADRKVLKTIVYREGAAYVEVRMRPGAWFGEVRVWRGARWPDLDRRWRGGMKWWIPWYSLEKQAMNAVRYVSGRTALAWLTANEVHAAIERLRRKLLEV